MKFGIQLSFGIPQNQNVPYSFSFYSQILSQILLTNYTTDISLAQYFPRKFFGYFFFLSH